MNIPFTSYWIKNSNNKIKAEFLAALMGSDGYVISKAKNAKGDFNAIRFSFNKLESFSPFRINSLALKANPINPQCVVNL